MKQYYSNTKISGVVVVQDKDLNRILYKENKYNGLKAININWNFADYSKFYILFKNKGLVRSKHIIKMHVQDTKKREERDEEIERSDNNIK